MKKKKYSTPGARVLEPSELMPHIIAAVNGGGVFPLTVTGVSMKPFLQPGRDTVYIEKQSGELKKGDVLFCARGGSGVLHRVSRICTDCFYMTADAHIKPDAPYSYDDIIGKVAFFSRNGKKKRANTRLRRLCVSLHRILLRAAKLARGDR